ncbi:MAG: exodeoxyribonuclease VII large subunit [Planctomycetota bacterium]
MARRSRKEAQPAPDLFSGVPPDGAAASPAEPPTWRVGELTAKIAGCLGDLGSLRVEGEVSSLKRAASGHVYFDLKDESARISCAIWRSVAGRLALDTLDEGTEVVVHGKLDVYAPRGSYSLIVSKLEPRGIGALLAQLEERKRRLAAAGRFDRHRPVPAMPRCIGVVTSRDGAALRDFLRTRSLRWPAYPVRLAHTPVQGPGAALEIAAAIRRLGASGVDVVVVTRGGGSIEDLWAFNEEVVLDAIWECPVPVVSGVGHETDTTLADLQADFRAHTPTDAAQAVFPDRAELVAKLERVGNYLVGAMERTFEQREAGLARLALRRELKSANWLLEERERRLRDHFARLRGALELRLGDGANRTGALATRLERQSPRSRLERWAARLERAGGRLVESAARVVERGETRWTLASKRLDSVSPLRVLERGYSFTVRATDGEAVRSAAQLAVGERVRTRLAAGSFEAEVVAVTPTRDDA